MKDNERGFSLVELLTVMAILGVISSIAFPHWYDLAERAHNAAAASDYRQVKLAVFNALGDPSTPDQFVMRRIRGPAPLPAPLEEVNVTSDVRVTVFHRTRRRASGTTTTTRIEVRSLRGDQSYEYNEVNGVVTEQVVGF